MAEENDDILILKPPPIKKKKEVRGRKTAVTEISAQDELRRCHGQLQLLEMYGMGKPEKGKSIHVVSGGNVDLISYVKWLLLHWPHNPDFPRDSFGIAMAAAVNMLINSLTKGMDVIIDYDCTIPRSRSRMESMHTLDSMRLNDWRLSAEGMPGRLSESLSHRS